MMESTNKQELEKIIEDWIITGFFHLIDSFILKKFSLHELAKTSAKLGTRLDKLATQMISEAINSISIIPVIEFLKLDRLEELEKEALDKIKIDKIQLYAPEIFTTQIFHSSDNEIEKELRDFLVRNHRQDLIKKLEELKREANPEESTRLIEEIARLYLLSFFKVLKENREDIIEQLKTLSAQSKLAQKIEEIMPIALEVLGIRFLITVLGEVKDVEILKKLSIKFTPAWKAALIRWRETCYGWRDDENEILIDIEKEFKGYFWAVIKNQDILDSNIKEYHGDFFTPPTEGQQSALIGIWDALKTLSKKVVNDILEMSVDNLKAYLAKSIARHISADQKKSLKVSFYEVQESSEKSIEDFPAERKGLIIIEYLTEDEKQSLNKTYGKKASRIVEYLLREFKQYQPVVEKTQLAKACQLHRNTLRLYQNRFRQNPRFLSAILRTHINF